MQHISSNGCVERESHAATARSVTESTSLSTSPISINRVLPKIDPKDIRIHNGRPYVGATTDNSAHGTSEVASAKEISTAGQNSSTITVQALDPKGFPHLSTSARPLATIENIAHLMVSYGVTARYNVIKKQTELHFPYIGEDGGCVGAQALTYVISLASLNQIPNGNVPAFVDAIAERNPYNPAAEWILSKSWDQVDRLSSFYSVLTERPDYPSDLKHVLMYRWLLSAAAAVLRPDFMARGVLVLQGPQHIGKTSFFRSLISDPVLAKSVFKDGQHIDGNDKDSLITAIAHWIVELGELEGTLRKDLARLKGFLTSTTDKIRRPYARSDSEYPRRTVFGASVNEDQFLVDPTGNSRWWTIPVIQVNYNHGIDMQQVFAQLAIDLESGAQWWLTRDEEKMLEAQNVAHRSVSVIREQLIESFDMERKDFPNWPAMTAIQVLLELGYDRPTNPQCKDCASHLRDLLGEPKRINGQYKWRVPLRHGRHQPSTVRVSKLY